MLFAVPSVGAQETDGWYVLAMKSIEGPRDRESAVETVLGEPVEMIGFKTLDGDVQCTRISASFKDGHSRWLALDTAEVFEEGTLHPFDLSQDDSPLIRLNFTCEAVAGTKVAMLILGRD